MPEKHTPGPWHVTEAEIPSGEIMVLGGEGFEFGLIAAATYLSDAHLIAAAPDLLEAVQAGVKMRDAQRKYFANRTQDNLLSAKSAEREFDHAARAAIAKAEDRP